MRFQCWLKLTMHSSADLQGMKKLPAAKSQQRIFTLFSSVWLGIVPKGSSSLLSLAAKQKNLKNPISNNYENKHFSVKELLFSSVDTCITITRTLTLIPEKSLSRCNTRNFLWENKRREEIEEDFSRVNVTQCVSCMERDAFMWWFLCLEYRLSVVSDATRMFAQHIG